MTVPATTRRAFTLIEVMIVISIVAIVMTAGIPMMWKALAKDQLASAVNDVIEGCKAARERAILQDRPYDFVVRNKNETDTEMLVEASKIRDPSGLAFAGGDTPIRDTGLIGGFPRQLGADVIVELVAVNFIDHMGASEARARFYPNGMSDDFTIVFQHNGRQRTVTVDIITGTAYELIK